MILLKNPYYVTLKRKRRNRGLQSTVKQIHADPTHEIKLVTIDWVAFLDFF